MFVFISSKHFITVDSLASEKSKKYQCYFTLVLPQTQFYFSGNQHLSALARHLLGFVTYILEPVVINCRSAVNYIFVNNKLLLKKN